MRRLTVKELIQVKKKLYRDQRGKCAICKNRFSEPKDVCGDHNHKTGHLRALLCRNCNSMNGKIMNCANRAKRASTALIWLGKMIAYEVYHAANPSQWLHPSHRTDDEKRLRRNKRATKRRKLNKAGLS